MMKLAELGLTLVWVALGFTAGAAWQARQNEARPQASPQVAQAPWLTGTPEERFQRIETQLRGLDVAMIEVGYRFTELYFAGRDRNWDYATYQLDKIELATRLALERRPKRAKSAQPFLNHALPVVRKAIADRKASQFGQAMERLRMSCMKCHADENVPHFTVEMPEQRLSTIRTVR